MELERNEKFIGLVERNWNGTKKSEVERNWNGTKFYIMERIGTERKQISTLNCD